MSYLQTSGSQIGTKVCYISLQNVSKYVFFTKKGFLSYLPNSFLFSHEFNMSLSVTGNKNPYGSDTKTLCISIVKEFIIKTYKSFWYKPSRSSSLIGCYNAMYVTLDKIQIRTLVHPQKPDHYLYNSFLLYFLSLCFK